MKTRAPVSAVQINNRDSQRDDGRISPQAGIVYELSDPVVLYAAYGEGFRANIGTDVNGDIFMPEETRSIEAGAKLSLLGGAISGTLAVFNLDKENVLASDIRYHLARLKPSGSPSDLRLIRLLMFQHAKRDMDELTHGSRECAHLGLAAGRQAVILRGDIRVVAQTHDGRHIQAASQRGGTGLGQPGAPAHRTPGFMRHRHQPDKRRCLAGAVE